MLKDMKIGLRLLVAFGLVFAILLFIGGFSIARMSSLDNDITLLVKDRWPKAEIANNIKENTNIIARCIRNMLLLNDKDEIQKESLRISGAKDNISNKLATLEKMIRTAEGKSLLNRVIEARTSYEAIVKEIVEKIDTGKKEEALSIMIVKLRPVQTAYFDTLDGLIKYQGGLMNEASTAAAANYRLSRNLLIIAIVIALGLIIAVTFLISMSIIKPLSKATNSANRIADGDLTEEIEVSSKDEVGELLAAMKMMIKNLRQITGHIGGSSSTLASSSEELSATVGQITKRMDEQSGRVQQLATASSEMSQTVSDIAKNATEIAASAKEALTTAEEGEHVVRQTVDEVQSIAKMVTESSQQISSLGEQSKKIGEIVSVIKDIADQTNLLALNAAIEAARAGEQGRGFAVVADEVRKLAERTQGATGEIVGMITSTQAGTQNAVSSMQETLQMVAKGVTLSKEAGDSLGQIVNSVNNLQTGVHQIASATEEMSAVSQQISVDIELVATVSQETSSGASQIAAASNDLAGLSSALKSEASRFKCAA